MMILAVLLIIVAIAITYLAHVQRRTVEAQADLINHLVDVVTEHKGGSSGENGDKMRDIVSKVQALPS